MVRTMAVGLINRPTNRAPSRPANERAPKPLVLVVDDDKRQAELRAELLSQAGCTTVVAATAADALTTIGDLIRLDLVVTDLHLGRHTEDRAGVVVAHAARDRFPGIPVVALVPYTSAPFVSEGDRSAFATIVEKGVRNVPELRAFVEQLAVLARNHLASTTGGTR